MLIFTQRLPQSSDASVNKLLFTLPLSFAEILPFQPEIGAYHQH